MSESSALTTIGLTKSYGKVKALRGVDVEVERGEIFGLLGEIEYLKEGTPTEEAGAPAFRAALPH